MIKDGKEFKQIKGYDDYISKDGQIYRPRNDRYIKVHKVYGTKTNRPYKSCFVEKNKEIVCLTLHKALALAWIPLPRGYSYDDVETDKRILVVDHIDGDKLNNDINNLRWVTQSENLRNPNIKRKVRDDNYGNKKNARFHKERYTYHYNGKDYTSAKQVAKAMGVSVSSVTEAFRHNFQIVERGILTRDPR